MESLYLEGYSLVDDKEGTFYFSFSFSNKSMLSHLILNSEGNLVKTNSDNGKDWTVEWSSLISDCNSQNSPICSCLEGFEPKNIEEWNGGNWTSGCVRRTPLNCNRVSTSGKEGEKDGFLQIKMMKMPDLADCAYEAGIGCMSWNRELIDSQKLSIGGVDLYVRVAYSELENVNINTMNQDKLEELPMFTFEELASAKNNFDQSNKLGQGRFGLVYKRKLLDGHEIAVKRLARTSGQGLEEFLNEVVVISKFQHRNLVRLLGQCIEGEEKLLVYEYMPNKSLDTFLFDPVKQEQLDWRKCFNIIEGIDLKASNILLDEELNPKISNFGMVRIFGGNEDQANTRRVVGTFGYMSPEYAMEGCFSEKSDIFSFGVLLLEIVSGRRNISFHHDERAMTLLGFAWKLWDTNNIATLIDPMILEPCFEMEILRCIQYVGLLCVQDFAKDRPTVSIAISMLKSEIVGLPHPKQPAYTAIQVTPRTDQSSSHSQRVCSINNVTVTMVQGR
ncbi:hypothetical protein CIPAW_10G125100 [Carya illinoinensis]|uniref:Protein kinase domain-containing protein n=1 Tax=Carya illinoinensis TaxID=32201 RepID=A0A8T1PDQ7_CARIL|nr:hypothetical protein CIPAW_10G125100 [Carya illinoinensis]